MKHSALVELDLDDLVQFMKVRELNRLISICQSRKEWLQTQTLTAEEQQLAQKGGSDRLEAIKKVRARLDIGVGAASEKVQDYLSGL